MEYEVQLVPVDKAVVTPQGFFEPLCSSCSSVDWVEREGIIRQVVNCKGYIGDAIPPMGTQS
jgi:hypothetical protein